MVSGSVPYLPLLCSGGELLSADFPSGVSATAHTHHRAERPAANSPARGAKAGHSVPLSCCWQKGKLMRASYFVAGFRELWGYRNLSQKEERWNFSFFFAAEMSSLSTLTGAGLSGETGEPPS